MTESPGYDLAVLKELIDGIGKEGAAEVVQAVVTDAPSLMQGLRAAMAASDRKGVRLYAHTMKSNGRIVGAAAFSDRCGQLEETAATGGDLVAAQAQAAEILAGFERLLGDLSEWLKA